MVNKSNIFVSVFENADGYAVYHCMDDHNLSAGDKVRIQAIENENYTTKEATVIESGGHIFTTDQKYQGDGYGVFSKHETTTQRAFFGFAAIAVVIYLIYRYKNK